MRNAGDACTVTWCHSQGLGVKRNHVSEPLVCLMLQVVCTMVFDKVLTVYYCNHPDRPLVNFVQARMCALHVQKCYIRSSSGDKHASRDAVILASQSSLGKIPNITKDPNLGSGIN